MTKLEKAQRFARNMRRQMTRRRHKALLNTDKDKSYDLHHEYTMKVIEFFAGLKEMGFRTTNHDEPGRVGRIVPITKLKVFVLQHEQDATKDVKFIGVYSSLENAQIARTRLSQAPGFSESLDGFYIDEYQVDKTHWTGGFT